MAVLRRNFETADAMFDTLAGDIARRLTEAIVIRGQASLVVSGGVTPVPLYDRLAACDLPWSRVWVVPSDERCVEETSHDSNESMLRDHLFTSRAAGAHFVSLARSAMPAEIKALRSLRRPFDVVLLGMGAEGHVASLFPGAAGLAHAMDPAACVLTARLHVPGAAGSAERVTLTLPTLLDARMIYLLIEGDEKSAALDAASMPGSIEEAPVRGIILQNETPVEVFWAP
jgi:6-phosphogluconolactonase